MRFMIVDEESKCCKCKRRIDKDKEVNFNIAKDEFTCYKCRKKK